MQHYIKKEAKINDKFTSMVKLVGNAESKQVSSNDLELKFENIVECSRIYYGLSSRNVRLWISV